MSVQAPTLTVTVTSYNYGKYLSRNIESILNQSFTDFELIIIDDVSTDNSVEIIKRYAAQDERIRFINHTENKGITPSLIESCELARGKYRVHLDSDDWIVDPNAFALQVAIFERDPEVALVCSPIAHFTNNEQRTLLLSAYDHDTVRPGEEAVEHVLRFLITHTGTMMRMSAYRAFGGYDRRYKYVTDLKLNADLCAQGKMGYINRLLYAYRQHAESTSVSAKFRRWQEENLHLINAVFDGPIAARMADPERMRRALISNALLARATHEIFGGRLRMGWALWWNSFRLMPRATLFQSRNFNLLLRSTIGESGFRALEQLYANMNPQKRRKLAEAASARERVVVPE